MKRISLALALLLASATALVGQSFPVKANASGVVTEPTTISLANTALTLPTSFTWAGTLGATNGGTGQSTWTLGDFLYANGTNTLAKLAGNTSATLAVLTQTGTGTVSAAPVWTSTTGTGNVVRATSPTLVTPTIDTITAPASTALTLTGGSTGASLVLGATASGIATITTGTPTTGRLNVGAANIFVTGGSAGLWLNASGAFDVGAYEASGALRFRTGTADKMSLTSTGNLLIGTTTDAASLSGGLVVNGSGAGAAASSTTTGALRVTGGVGVSGAGYFGGLIGLSGAGSDATTGINWGTSTTLYQTQAGRLALNHVGGTLPVLSLLENGTPRGNIYTAAGTMTVGTVGAFPLNIQTNNATALRIGATGVVDVPGTTSASSSTVGALTIGNGTAATNVAIGGGNVNAGGTLVVGGAASVGAAVSTGLGFNVILDPGTLTYGAANAWLGARIRPARAGTTGNAFGISSQLEVTSGTQTKGATFMSEAPSGTITNHTHFYANSSGSRVAPTGNYSLYAESAAGPAYIGDTTPSVGSTSGALQVAGGIYAGANSLMKTLGLVADVTAYNYDATLSNYSSTNGVYLNGNAAGWLRLSGSGGGVAQIQLNGGVAGAITMNTATANALVLHGTTGAATFAGAVTAGNGIAAIARTNAAYPGVFNITATPNVTTDLFGYGDGTRHGLIRGNQNGANISDFRFGYWASPTFTESFRVTTSGNGVGNASTAVNIYGTSASTGSTSGALQVAGGIYAGAASVFGGQVEFKNSATVSALIRSVNPRIAWVNTGAAADEGRWDNYNTGNTFSLRAVNDADSGANYAFTATRSGFTVTNLAFGGTSATFAGAVTAGGLISTSGSFASGRAFSGTTPAGSSVGLRLLQTSVSDWQIENTATTGALTFAQSTVPYFTLTGLAATFAGAVTVGSSSGITSAGNLTLQTATDSRINFIAGQTAWLNYNLAADRWTFRHTTSGVTSLTLTEAAATVANAVVTASATLSGAGAIPITTSLVKFTSTGAAQALTLANGVDGQRLTIVHDVDGGSGVLTPTTKTGFSTVTFTNVGETVSLVYVTTRGWMVTGSYLATIAP